MKKILLFTSLAVVLTACSSNEETKVSNKTTSTVSQITQTTKESNTTTSGKQTSGTEVTQVTTAKENATQSASAEKTTNNTADIASQFASAGSSIEKLIAIVGQKHVIAGSEYQTSAVSSLDEITKEYNTVKSAQLSKDEVLAEIDKNTVLERVSASFNEEDIRRIFAKDPESVVIYFEEDGKLFFAQK